jgi:hypothetical protein
MCKGHFRVRTTERSGPAQATRRPTDSIRRGKCRATGNMGPTPCAIITYDGRNYSCWDRDHLSPGVSPGYESLCARRRVVFERPIYSPGGRSRGACPPVSLFVISRSPASWNICVMPAKIHFVSGRQAGAASRQERPDVCFGLQARTRGRRSNSPMRAILNTPAGRAGPPRMNPGCGLPRLSGHRTADERSIGRRAASCGGSCSG